MSAAAPARDRAALIRVLIACLAALIVWQLAAASADAAFLGANGKLAISSPRSGYPADSDVYTLNADGTAETRITSLDQDELNPTWSPDGTKLLFDRNPDLRPDVYAANADGSNRVQLTTDAASDLRPAWSYNGTQIVFASDRNNTPGVFDLFVMNANGTNQVNITNTPTIDEDYPAWSPDGSVIAFSRDGDIYTMTPGGTNLVRLTTGAGDEIEPDWSPDSRQLVYRTGISTNDDIWRMNSNGTAQTNLTNDGSLVDEAPVWSPSGDKIAFIRDAFKNADVYTMNPDGTGATRITNNTLMDAHPTWQPLPLSGGFVRPKGAGPLLVALVPAFRQCKFPNLIHGGGWNKPSCKSNLSPKLMSRYLTMGTSDANGQSSNFQGSIQVNPVIGNPGTTADEADLSVRISMSDVRKQSDLSDYTGQLRVRAETRRQTDRDNVAAGSPTDGGTSTDAPWAFTVQCVATADVSIGSNCNLTTTIDAMSPGTIKEGKRAMFQFGRFEVWDGGSDGNVQTQVNDLFAVQGLFVP